MLTMNGRSEMTSTGGTEAMWRELGRQLAALRRAAGLTQVSLGAQAGFSRTTVSVAEIGRAVPSDDFWQACDKALRSGGALTTGAAQIKAAQRASEHAAARAAQEAREAQALAAFTAAQDQRGVSAEVSAVQPCPNCGSDVTILTTLIPRARVTGAHEPLARASSALGAGRVPPGGITQERRPKAIRTT